MEQGMMIKLALFVILSYLLMPLLGSFVDTHTHTFYNLVHVVCS